MFWMLAPLEPVCCRFCQRASITGVATKSSSCPVKRRENLSFGVHNRSPRYRVFLLLPYHWPFSRDLDQPPWSWMATVTLPVSVLVIGMSTATLP